MSTIDDIADLSEKYEMPLEDVLFVALNTHGVNHDCEYDRIRMDFRLDDSNLFAYAKAREELDYFFALPVNPNSPFTLTSDTLSLQDSFIGKAINPEEDVSELYYFRRKGTALNFNPNSRSSCAGCDFCYTSRLTPNDAQRINTGTDLKISLENWMKTADLSDLSHLVRIAVVTGNYKDSDNLFQFLLELKRVVQEYKFNGEIFYLGSQIVKPDQLQQLVEIQPFAICFSLETFERRDLLRRDKKALTLDDAHKAMDYALGLGHQVNYSYIVGMESLQVLGRHTSRFMTCINRFPIFNIFQRHKFQGSTLMDPTADSLEYFLNARRICERLFSKTNLRPIPWENYRSLWSLTFDKEMLYGIRTPYGAHSNVAAYPAGGVRLVSGDRL
jgi:hypothetical protein